ncbi:hypothetical protein vseg_002205 [Gypsophila vaccaria]
MSNVVGEEQSDVVLSDVEEDDENSISDANSSTNDVVSVEKYRELVEELERERKGKAELQVSFNRLKALAHEAIRKRDESGRGRDEAVREKEEVEKLLEKSQAEIETVAQMLVTGIDKISGKVGHIKSFTGVGLPKSEKYTGLPAVAYGVVKRANEIVEAVLREVEAANKARNEARERVEERNYEIAIEVSELEASIGRLRDEVAEKSGRIEEVENERAELRKVVGELEGRMEGQRHLLVEHLSLVSRIHDELYGVIRVVDVGNGDHSEFAESLFLPQETGLEENLRAGLAGLESIFELSKVVGGKTRDVVEEKSRAVKSLNETVARLFREKEHVGVLLRSALSKRLTSTNAVFQVAENGLREAGIEFKFGAFFDDEKFGTSQSKDGGQETKDDEIYALAGALENIIKEAQLQIIELQHSVDELRAESSLLKDRLETQGKELSQKKHRIEELELRERQANENIQGLMMDIAAAEEEITRWKGAAEQEAAAGSAVEQEYLTQIASLKQEVEEVKQAMAETAKKLKYKEETAEAAMAAREAAEKSLRLADIRASRLRDRVEELTHQLENLDNKDEGRSRTRPRYVCWPWEWLGIDMVGYRRPIEPPPEQLNSNEMELSEPLL